MKSNFRQCIRVLLLQSPPGQVLMCNLSFQLRAEVQRLEMLKMQSMKSVIEAIRAEIALFWESCFYSQEQQQAFVAYHAGE